MKLPFARGIIGKFDAHLLVCLFVILSLGLLESYSLAPSLKSGSLLFQKQLFFVFTGILLMLVFTFLDYRYFKENILIPLLLFFIIITILIFLLFFGEPIGGAKSWVKLGAFNLGPVEILKVVLVLILAKFFSVRHIEIFRWRHLLSSFVYIIIPLALILAQPDAGSGAILFLLWLGMLFLAGVPFRHFLIVFLVGLIFIGAGWFFVMRDYQKARIISYLDPYDDPLGQGYNIIQSLTAISAGGFWGKGLGFGTVSQLGFLPARHTDFIFSSLAEEMGLLGIIVLLFCYLIIFWRLVIIAADAKDNFGRLVVAGTVILLASQCLVNIGVAIGFLPITGLALPFISYGGSGMVSFLILLGIAQSVKFNQ